jgi:hypothetical protein
VNARGVAARSWIAVCVGLLLGFVAALAGTQAWNLFGGGRDVAAVPRRTSAAIDLFRLTSGGDREMVLVPAGADADGEPALSRALFPGEEPPRDLATLLLANLSPNAPWQVDLAADPLACRAGDADWTPLQRVGPDVAKELAPPALLRLRALSAAGSVVVVEPASLRRVLYALPANRRFGQLSDVQWGKTKLARDRLDLERIRHFREDPAGATTGR